MIGIGMNQTVAYFVAMFLGAVLIGYATRRATSWLSIPFMFIWYVALTMIYYR